MTNLTQAGPAGYWLSGESDATTVADGSFAAWRGRTIDIGGVWAATDTADHQISSPMWSLTPGNPYSRTPRMDYAAGGPLHGETWVEAAAGNLDNRWIKQLQALKAGWGSRAPSDMYIRFAHEMNGDWFSWSVPPDQIQNFIVSWRRFYTLMRIYFPGANLVWCTNALSSWNYDVRSLWPGDDYVDVIGVDAYNRYPWVNTQDGFDATINSSDKFGAPVGIEKWREFALLHNKTMAIPEWANASVPNNGGGGGDAPVFFTLFHDWLKQHGGASKGDLLYEILFNVKGFDEHYELFNDGQLSTLQSKSAVAYQALW